MRAGRGGELATLAFALHLIGHPSSRRLGFDSHIANESPAIMSSQSLPLQALWEAAAGQEYQPTIGKESQFTVGFSLLVAGNFKQRPRSRHLLISFLQLCCSLACLDLVRKGACTPWMSSLTSTTDPSFKNVILCGIPASVAAG